MSATNHSCTNLNIDNYEATKAAVKADPSVGRGQFEAVTTWTDGAQASTTARTFTIKTDEPAPLGGKDEHIDPMELLLAAVGSCLTIGWVTHARQKGIDFRALTIKVQGDYDLRGYLGTDDSVRPGFTSLRYIVEVDSDAAPEVLNEIRQAAEAGSPMVDNVVAATPLLGEVKQSSTVGR